MGYNMIIAKAILARVLFILHAVVCMFRVHARNHNQMHFLLLTPLVVLLAETYFTLRYKKNGEWKWFCPSVFLYLCSVIPSTWFIELDLLEKRVTHTNMTKNFTDSTPTTDGKDATTLNGFHEEEHHDKYLVLEGLIIPIMFSPEGWAKVLEQLLLLILIIGRWLLPKGKITRDQLSQLLLVYIGMAADILELFEAFKEDIVQTNIILTMAILGCWSLSVLQFSLVVTSTRKRSKRKRKWHHDHCCFCCETEIWAIATTVLMQDLPFLVLRLLLIVKFKVLSYMNIFFTCKNTLVVLLQVYRGFTLCYERERVLKKNGEITLVRHVSTTANLCEHSRDYSWKSLSMTTDLSPETDITDVRPIIKRRTDLMLPSPESWHEDADAKSQAVTPQNCNYLPQTRIPPSISYELERANSIQRNIRNTPAYIADTEDL
ncbi:transmembrane protein 26-like [Tubulanus polymorphus]|uniref:transmembrane protein 26-like n=1 Tax=Tubulanus polymorphus TaxID=672921 RepID=UPI003DA5C893